ncbi:MAG TPA: 16S rRNA (adenine(1518)-N(6)/adenine(1519)-N(6))-dimethyltransferase RsmA [Thermodesulfobacteriota bacterium]|nr:16S rRNA (adenine(1518)-N(6)/adenine(1519)-N(6))-dimethyltransferase RsmA [Thermodesulfobacteriota bacterium]
MASIRQELAEHGLFAKKRLGQHFLVDRNILSKVVQTAEIRKEDVILEIGPGLGEMTLALARSARRVIAVEIDAALAEILRKKLADLPNVEVVKSDILKVDFKSLFEEERRPVKVVANLPYQISTPLLFRFIESKEFFSTLTLMLQKEVAARMAAPPGGKEYGPLSIFVQVYLDASVRFSIKPSAFFPAPKVDSAVVHMVWKGNPRVESQDEEWFKKVVKASFGYRRKTLVNALKHSELPLPDSIESKMEAAEIDPRRRPETLTMEEFIRLAAALK